MYGSSKIHKPLVNGFPKLRPILSALHTSTYICAKNVFPLLRNLTSNEFTLKDSFELAKRICEQGDALFMAHLEVDSLFTNVPLHEIIDNELFKGNSSIHGLNKKQIKFVKSELIRSLHKRLHFCKIKIVFKVSNRLKNYFSFEDIVRELLRSCQIYNFTCGSCNASHTGKTFMHMKVTVSNTNSITLSR